MIPRYAPEWTNHNPSDPGITLIELAAWMTDLLIYRLNQVPDKNYVAFLNLLGIKLRAPRAAQGAHPVHARRGRDQAARSARHAGVDAARDRGAHGHVRDRARRRRHRRARPDRCFSYFDESYSENSRYIDPAPGTVTARSRCSPARSASSASCTCRIRASRTPATRRCCASSSARPSAAAATSRACSSGSTGTARAGRRWSRRRSRSIAARSRSWARCGSSRRRSTTSRACGCAVASPRCPSRPRTPRSTRSARASRSSARASLPTQAYANLDNNAFLQLDLGKNIYPFGKEPKVDCLLYLACDELLQTADAYISIEMLLADSSVIPRPNPSDQLVLAWEYWDGKRWRHLGRSAPRGALPGAGDELGFHDDTKALSQSGTVSFRRPKDMDGARDQRRRQDAGSASASRRATTASRARTRSRTRSGSSRTTARCGRPRCARSRSAIARTIATCGTCSRSTTSSSPTVTEVARTEYTIFQPFSAKPEESPALYLGFVAQAAERSARALLPARRGARPRLAADRRGRGRDDRARQVRDDAPARLGGRPARRLGVLGRPRVGAARRRRRDPRLHVSRASRSSSRPTTG